MTHKQIFEEHSFLHMSLINLHTMSNSLISPVFMVTLNVEQTLAHSGGGASVHVFVPTICACHDGLPT